MTRENKLLFNEYLCAKWMEHHAPVRRGWSIMLQKYKICVYAICKNEVQFVDRWMDSMSEADLVVVTDTGSTDGTAQKLRSRGAIIYKEKINPWRFDVARNISLKHIPKNMDICVCTDLDEVFEKGWRECLEKTWTPDAKMGRYLYNWSHKSDGTPDVQFNYFKVHARRDFEWYMPVHECIKYVGKSPATTVYIDGMVLNHYPDHTKSRGSYLPLLELAAKENPEGDRANYYLGREYSFVGEWDKCIQTLKNYLSLESALWNEERCASMRKIADSHYKLHNNKEAISWYYRAIAEAPHMREPYVECAKMAYELNEWALVFFMVEEALKIKEKSQTYINLASSWDFTLDDLGAISCYQLGMYEKSLSHAKAALELAPNDERLINNLRLIEEKVNVIGVNT
jgi:glycosyltransferase involved in cell wall biosynthesis